MCHRSLQNKYFGKELAVTDIGVFFTSLSSLHRDLYEFLDINDSVIY